MPEKREVLVVLGSPNSSSGELSQISLSRLDACAGLFTSGKLILCTGGWGPHFNTTKTSHASYARSYLIHKGLSEDDFLEPALSKNTVDDAVKVRKVISTLENVRLVIITSDYHLERTTMIFSEILSEYELNFVGVQADIDKKQYETLLSHEREAIADILKKGLYYRV